MLKTTLSADHSVIVVDLSAIKSEMYLEDMPCKALNVIKITSKFPLGANIVGICNQDYAVIIVMMMIFLVMSIANLSTTTKYDEDEFLSAVKWG